MTRPTPRLTPVLAGTVVLSGALITLAVAPKATTGKPAEPVIVAPPGTVPTTRPTSSTAPASRPATAPATMRTPHIEQKLGDMPTTVPTWAPPPSR